METEVFVLCDAATDYRGKLNILGTFDTTRTTGFPMVLPHCALALRLRFTMMEEGSHPVSISLRNPEGKEMMPPMRGEFRFQVPPGRFSAAANLVLNMDGLRFAEPGEYIFELDIDGKRTRTIPLYLLGPPPAPPAPSGEAG